jgi:hypothetical protein
LSGAAQTPVTLEPLYYQGNFETLCATVQAQYEDLLNEREQCFYHLYRTAPLPARCLYVRLLSRRGPYFRREQLNYPEIGPLEPVIEECLRAGLLAVVESPDPAALLHLLRKAELLDIFAVELKSMSAARKADIQQYLLEQVGEDRLLAAWREWSEPDALLEVCYLDCVELFQLLFFGNRRQDLTEFVLSDLGVMRYMDYRLDRRERLFEDRSHVDDYLLVAGLRDVFDQAREAGDIEALLGLLEPLCRRGETPLLEQRRDRLRNRVARQLERWERWDAAMHLYGECGQHPARERRVRILQARGDFAEALNLCRTMERAPWCEAERDFLRRQVPALSRKLDLPCDSLPRDAFVEDRLQLDASPSVERAAALWYEGEWERVHYVENLLPNAIFGLAFWDQIFQPVSGAFVNPFQAAPLDMYTADFYRRRRDSIEGRLGELSGGDLATALLAVYDREYEISNRWVNWRYLPRELLEQALSLIPADHWLGILRRILFDPEANRSGFPDLLALDSERGYCFIEVKGPGDQLQLNQRRWLRYFQQSGIPARVSWVRWNDD